jgi:hypothetical protein
MSAVPLRLVQNTERLCQIIRQRGIDDCTEGIGCYRNIVRANLSEVLKCTFPLFINELGKEGQAHFVEGFLNKHQATEPEYHHIATEWVRFVQEQPGLTSKQLALMEFEWVLFSVEIADEKVQAPPDVVVLKNINIDDCVIRLNPTVVAIELPFILDEPNNDELTGSKSIYVVYRDDVHHVCYKRLTLFERCLINTLDGNEAKPVSEIKQTISEHLTSQVLNEWILHHLSSGLLVL